MKTQRFNTQQNATKAAKIKQTFGAKVEVFDLGTAVKMKRYFVGTPLEFNALTKRFFCEKQKLSLS